MKTTKPNLRESGPAPCTFKNKQRFLTHGTDLGHEIHSPDVVRNNSSLQESTAMKPRDRQRLQEFFLPRFDFGKRVSQIEFELHTINSEMLMFCNFHRMTCLKHLQTFKISCTQEFQNSHDMSFKGSRWISCGQPIGCTQGIVRLYGRIIIIILLCLPWSLIRIAYLHSKPFLNQISLLRQRSTSYYSHTNDCKEVLDDGPSQPSRYHHFTCQPWPLAYPIPHLLDLKSKNRTWCRLFKIEVTVLDALETLFDMAGRITLTLVFKSTKYS